MYRVDCMVWTKDKQYDLSLSDWIKFDQSKLHREDGPAVQHANGNKEWRINGKLHRLDGPAFIGSHVKVWFIHGKKHRLIGPAVEASEDMEIEKEGEGDRWFINNKRLAITPPNLRNEIQDWIKENNINLLTESGQMAFILKWR